MSNFSGSLEMPLIKRKIELKPKQMKGGVLAAASDDITHFNINSRQKNHLFLSSLYQQNTTAIKFQNCELSHELSLSTRQKAKIGNVFSNIMSFDT